MTELTGEVVSWKFAPKLDTGWHVIHVRCDAGLNHTVTGCSLPRPGARVVLVGEHRDTPYGRQFHVRTIAQSRPPLSADGVQRWLCERVAGIGMVKASKLLEHFSGDAAQLWAALQADAALSVDGVQPDLVQAAREAVLADGADAQFRALLYGWGLTQSQLIRIAAHWTLDDATRLLSRNPYLLADHIDGFGFRRADAVGERLGIRHDDPVRLCAAVLHYLEQAVGEGHCFGDVAVFKQMARESRTSLNVLITAAQALAAQGRVVIEDGSRVYLAELHLAELSVAVDLRSRLSCISDARKSLPAGDAIVVDRADTADDPLQRAAIDAICSDAELVFVTGGPGTGKTTVLEQALNRLEAAKRTVHLAAPTGKAAKRMAEATGRRAHTLHSLLGYRPSRETDCEVCKGESAIYDWSKMGDVTGAVIIVDEASMVDIRLWAALATAARGACLRFIGDAEQLPPVGGGQPFRDALDVVPDASMVRLRTVYRAKGEWCKAAAPAVLAGQVPPLTPAPGLRFVEVRDADDIVPSVLGVFGGAHDDQYFSAAGALDIGHMPVLVPQRTGRAGVARIANALHDAFNPAEDVQAIALEDDTQLRVGSWVMVIKNNARKRVCNGDTGRIVELTEQGCLVAIDGVDEPPVMYYAADARAELRLAYASTVHKAQGSEYPWVVVVCHSIHQRMLTRRLLYTAITRAREGVVLVGDRDGIEHAIANTREVARCTWLKQRLTR